MKFSIILPIYKVEKYLRECVDSILCQTFTDFEIILVDDGSPDSCPQICDEYVSRDSRIKVIHKPNGGLADARNVGTEAAKGEYIWYIDSDDFLIDERVFERVAEKTANNPDVIHYKFVEWFESDSHIAPCKFDYKVITDGRSISDIYCDLIDKDAYYNSAWSKVIRRELLVKNMIHFEKGILGEDNEWFYHVVIVAKRITLIDEALYVYRRREGSITTTATEKNLKDQLHVLTKWSKLLKVHEDNPCIKVVQGSLAKQYCSALIIYAELTNVESYLPALKQKAYMLNYSKNKRVVIFRWLKRLVGVSGIIWLLRKYIK